MTENRFTPATIGMHKFTIPLYQRLFEWEEEQVQQLLNDLFSAFKTNKENPYYIGVLTVFKEESQGRYSLVDGQQRFTVLMLMGIALGWSEFLKVNDELRLTFFARENDETYLTSKVDDNLPVKGYINAKMDKAIEVIHSFLRKENTSEQFKTYIKE